MTFGPLLAVALDARASPLPPFSEPMDITRKGDFMTREQKKQLRRNALYILLLAGICLLLIAGLTS